MMSENIGMSSPSLAHRPLDLGQTHGPGHDWTLSGALCWTALDLAPGEILYREGSFADRLYMVTSGIVKLVAHMPNGRVRILGLHGPGTVLGLVTPASHRTTYNQTAVAVTDVETEWAATAQLRRIRRERSEEYLELVERHCEALRYAERWITEFSADTTTCRIARVIKYLAELQQLPEPDTVELLTCQEMAEVIGVSTESASRVLARFKRLGLLAPCASDQSSRLYRFDAAAIEEIAFA